MAWFRVQVLLRADAPNGGVSLLSAEYAVAAMDAMEAEDKAETIALTEACASNTAQWRWYSTQKTVKFSNSAQPLNDVRDGEQLQSQSLAFSTESALYDYLSKGS